MRSGAGSAELARGLAWQERGWPEFDCYWPLFELARRHRLPVIAADLEPAMVRRIAQEGLASLGSRAQALSSALPADAARESAIARTIQAAHCDLLPSARIPSMVESWHARNVTMARRIVEALGHGSPVVVIVGRGHQTAGGLPAQLEALRPGTRQLLVHLEETDRGDGDEPATAGDTRAVIWLTPPIPRPDPCESLRRQFPPAR